MTSDLHFFSGHFVFASFASAFLLKLLRPEFADFVTPEQTSQIFSLIGKLIQVLASSEVSIDDRHTPKLYARFLAGLLAKHQPGGSSSGRLHPGRPPESQFPEGDPSSGGQGPMGSGGSGQGVFHVGTGVAPSGGTPPHAGASQQRPLAAPDLSLAGVGSAAGPGGLPTSPMSGSGSMINTPMDTPIYEAEATYAAGTGPLELSSTDGGQFGFGGGLNGLGGYGGAMREEDMLATMHAIKNPAFWEDMMMPG